MIGIAITAIGTFFEEIATTIGKKEIHDKKETVYTMAFLYLFWGTFWFLGVILFKGEFIFSTASLPTFLTRFIFEIIQIHVSIWAIVLSERSTFGFVRTATLPMLLIVDLFLGYSILPIQMLGVIFIVSSLIIIFLNHGLSRNGLGFVIYSTFGAVVTVSLYKYDISNFNSVEAEQFVMHVLLVIYFFFVSLKLGHENPIKFMKHRIFFAQSFSRGATSAIISFAYLFAPASIIMAAERSTSVFWSVVFGKVYFYEKHVVVKIFSLTFLVIGIIMLIV